MALYRCGNNSNKVIESHYNYETSPGQISIDLKKGEKYYVSGYGEGIRDDGGPSVIVIEVSNGDTLPWVRREGVVTNTGGEFILFFSNNEYTPSSDVTIKLRSNNTTAGLTEGYLSAIHVDHLG